MSILVVDDSRDSRDIIGAVMASGGHDDVIFADSGESALEMLGISGTGEKPQISVILLDIMLPQMDGVETCARIRASHAFQGVPIIMITSRSDREAVSQAFVAGATDYITKPFERTELLARLRTALRLRGEGSLRRAKEDEVNALHRNLNPDEDGILEPGLDETTGIFNKGAMELMLRGRSRKPTCQAVMVFRIDRFREFQTHYNETTQARTLRAFTETVKHLKSSLGDELFQLETGTLVAFLGTASAEAVSKMARAAMERIRLLSIPHNGSLPLGLVTLSVGSAVRTSPGDARDLLVDAMSALDSAIKDGVEKSNIVTQDVP